MVLERQADGSHSFTAPVSPYVGTQDPFGRGEGPGSPARRQPGPMKFSQPVRINAPQFLQGYEVYTFQATIDDIRGTWIQEGESPDFSETSLVGDAKGVARHPFIFTTQNAGAGDWIDPTATGTTLDRMIWAFFKGTMFLTMGRADDVPFPAPTMWRETAADNPVITQVATYAPNAGSKQVICAAVVTTGGFTYLWLGYSTFSGAALGCESFADATLTPAVQVDASSGHTGAGAAVSGIIQAPNGDILIATTAGDLRVATDNTVTPGNVSFTTVQTQALGPYPVAVGNCALSNYAPGALWLCSLDDSLGLRFGFNNQFDETNRGRLILSSYDGLQLDPIDFHNLPYISFATIFDGGIIACDRRAHWWYTGKDMIPVDGGTDRPANSHKTRLCCGHGVKDDKFYILEAEIDDRFDVNAPNTDYDTIARVIEFDPYRSKTRPVSKTLDLGFGGGSLIVGGAPSLPVSPNTGNLHAFSIWEGLPAARATDTGRWLRQKQPDANRTGYSYRSTDQANPGNAETYDDLAHYLSPGFVHPQLEGFEYSGMRVIAGYGVEHLRTGGADAYISVNVGMYDELGNFHGYQDSNEAPQKLRADDPSGKVPMIELGVWPSRTWTTSLQLEMTSYQATTNGSHLTTNPLPITIEIMARRPLGRGLKL